MNMIPQFESGEANFLGGVASVKSVKGFNPEAAKKRFFEIYLDKVIEQFFMCFFIFPFLRYSKSA